VHIVRGHRCPKSPPMFTLPDHGVQLGVTTPAAMHPVAKLLMDTCGSDCTFYLLCCNLPVVHVIAVLGRVLCRTSRNDATIFHVSKHSITVIITIIVAVTILHHDSFVLRPQPTFSITKTCISCHRCTRATDSLTITVINYQSIVGGIVNSVDPRRSGFFALLASIFVDITFRQLICRSKIF